MTQYLVKTGMNFGTKRAEPGEVRSDIPKQSIPWLLDRGHIEPVEKKGKEK